MKKISFLVFVFALISLPLMATEKITTTPSGLRYSDPKMGPGPEAKAGQKVNKVGVTQKVAVNKIKEILKKRKLTLKSY